MVDEYPDPDVIIFSGNVSWLFQADKTDLYSSKKVSIPEAELYVIFTGNKIGQPEYISLSEEFFYGKQCSVEIRVKVLYGGDSKDIISQYVDFSKVYTEQVKKTWLYKGCGLGNNPHLQRQRCVGRVFKNQRKRGGINHDGTV